MSLGRDNHRWVLPAGTRGVGGWDMVVDESLEGWVHTGLLVARLDPGETRVLDLGNSEAVVVPLAGGLGLEVSDHVGVSTIELAGRADVFSGPSDVAYLPRGSRATLTAPPGDLARVAVALARDDTIAQPLPTRHIQAEEIPIELRGAGTASREVRNFGVPGVLDAGRIIVCEVITPAGNWSSWPPHKHDTERPGVETSLEEIYYFETRATHARGTDPVGYHRIHGTPDRPIDVLAEVRTGDVVLVPHGWHGPAMAAPDADLYYLNVMAGPGPERAWLICDDPAHSWVRSTWAEQELDARLPFGS